MPRDSNISQRSRNSSASGSRSGNAAKISPVVMNPRSLTCASTLPTWDDDWLVASSTGPTSAAGTVRSALVPADVSAEPSGSGVSIISDPRYQLLGDVLREIPMFGRPRICERVEHAFDLGAALVITSQHRRKETKT